MATGGKTALSEVEEREVLDLGLGEEINLDSDIRGAAAPPEVETPREPRVSGFAYTDVREGVISSRNYVTVERGEEVEQVPVFTPIYSVLWSGETLSKNPSQGHDCLCLRLCRSHMFLQLPSRFGARPLRQVPQTS